MPAFEYVALDEQGRRKKGTVQADHLRQVRQMLRAEQLSPLHIAVMNQRGLKMGFGRRRLSAQDVTLITRQLATLIASAVPIEEALQAVAAQQTGRVVSQIVTAVRARVLEGHTLSEAMEAFPGAFPRLYRATVAAGERSGHLSDILERLADYWERRQKSVQQIQLAILYPSILTVAAVGIVVFLLSYVVPEFVKVFANTGQALPLLTQGLIGLSKWVQHYGLYAVLIGVGLAGMLYRLLQKAYWRMRWHRLCLRLPIVGRFVRSYNTARFAATLSILSCSGVSLVEALRIAAHVLGNQCMQQAIDTGAQAVREGVSLHKALSDTGYFPPLMLHMIASGEKTGELGAMLGRVAHSQESELQHRMAVVLGLFEPMILVIMGGVVLMIVLAILMPIIDFNQMVG